jgi:hypothetical protein
MRVLSLIVALAGIVALALAVLSVFVPLNLQGIQPGGFLRGTVSLFLLALTLMVYDKAYPRKPAAPKRRKR